MKTAPREVGASPLFPCARCAEKQPTFPEAGCIYPEATPRDVCSSRSKIRAERVSCPRRSMLATISCCRLIFASVMVSRSSASLAASTLPSSPRSIAIASWRSPASTSATAPRSVYFIPLAELVVILAKAGREGTLRERIRFLCRASLLVVDEIDYLPVTRRSRKRTISASVSRQPADRGDVWQSPA
jgi:hypothetical protein